ncbi:MAG: SAM-dependent methyltransferase [Sphingobacteriales bacterium]|nr:MAG: SAM-dependent methyltransferase [Sphingobacteriales bacterium]
MKTENEYIITGGEEGKKRLNILSDVMYAYTKSLLTANGVSAGGSFLDVGCGGGNVSMMASQIVGGQGRVVGVDFDETIISLDNKDEQASGITNITYQAMSAYDIDFSNEFDTVYARFLLSHLTEPLKVLKRMAQSAKPGGKIVVEDIHFSGHFCYPACPAFDKYVQLFTEAGLKHGQNPEIGLELPSLFEKAGIKDIGFDVIQPTFQSGAGKWMGYITMDKIKDAVLSLGLADRQAIDNILAELEAYTKDEQSIISLPRIFRVWGTKG